MKTLLLLIWQVASLQSVAFAGEGPRFVCESKNSKDRVDVQAVEQTPFSKKLIITINKRHYVGLRNQVLRSKVWERTRAVYCFSQNELPYCSYADENQEIISLNFNGKETTLNSVYLDSKSLLIECKDGKMIWEE